MHRPTVLHVMEHWGRPSERFVLDTVRSTTATRAVIATQRRVDNPATQAFTGRVYDLSGCIDAVDADPWNEQVPPSAGARLASRLPGGVRYVHGALAAITAVERAAVLHSHFLMPAFPAWRASRKLFKPTSVSVHGWDLLVGMPQDKAMHSALKQAELVVVPSGYLRECVLGNEVRHARIRVIPSGVDLATMPFRERTAPLGVPTVTFAGRFAEKKGVLDVARALGQVQARTPVRGVFVGHGPLEGELRALISELRLNAEIIDGRVPGAVGTAMAATDLAVTASRTGDDGDAETLGVVNLEAQACGVPLVATRHGGVPEAVTPLAAELIAGHGDIPTSIADALLRLIADPSRWASMGRAGREWVAGNFELGARTADLERLWCQLAEGKREWELDTPTPPADPPKRASVVMVTHNRLPLLTQALDALQAQTRPADEIVVVDNGSTDGTAELLAQRPGITVLTRPDNLSVAEGRNLAVAASSGDVIAFTDDDCRPRPTWLEALLSGFRDEVGLVQGRTTADPAQPLERLSRTQWTPAEFGLYETCNIAYRREAFEEVGGFDLDFAEEVANTLGHRWERFPFGEDTDLAWRIKRSGVLSRFAVHAVVDHEVSPPDNALLVRRAALAAAFPLLVRRVPELRQSFLTGRFLLGRHRVALWLGAGGLAAAGLSTSALPLVLTVPYADRLFGLRTMHRPGGRAARLKDGAVLLGRDVRETAALVRGSVKARTPVL